MRISDWSSDVCSSDLDSAQHGGRLGIEALAEGFDLAAAGLPGGLLLLLRGGELLGLYHVVLEDLHRAGHQADLIPAISSRDFDRLVPVRQLAHRDRKITRLNSRH